MFNKLKEKISNIFRPKQGTEKRSFFQRLFNRKKQEPEKPREEMTPEERLKEFTKRKVKEYEEEKKRRMEEDQEEKAADQAAKEEEKRNGREKMNERYGYDWSDEQYDKFWDTFGGGEYKKYFPSETLMYAYDMALDVDLPFDRFQRVVQESINEADGRGYNQENAVDILFMKLDREIELWIKENEWKEYK